MAKIYSRKKVALVLAGGSARGFCHIGIIAGLEEMGIRPSLIVGTSMGAVVGAIYGTYTDAHALYSAARQYTPFDAISFTDFFAKHAIIKGTKIKQLLHSLIGDPKFSDLKIPLMVNATNFLDGTDYVFEKGDVVDALRASIGVPFIFEPVEYGNKVFVDGGLTSNLFFSELVPRAKEFDLFILVNLNHYNYQLKENFNAVDLAIQNLFITQKRIVDLSLHSLECSSSPYAKAFRKKMIVLHPDIRELNGAEWHMCDEFVGRGYEEFRSRKKEIVSKLR